MLSMIDEIAILFDVLFPKPLAKRQSRCSPGIRELSEHALFVSQTILVISPNVHTNLLACPDQHPRFRFRVAQLFARP